MEPPNPNRDFEELLVVDEELLVVDEVLLVDDTLVTGFVSTVSDFSETNKGAAALFFTDTTLTVVSFEIEVVLGVFATCAFSAGGGVGGRVTSVSVTVSAAFSEGDSSAGLLGETSGSSSSETLPTRSRGEGTGGNESAEDASGLQRAEKAFCLMELLGVVDGVLAVTSFVATTSWLLRLFLLSLVEKGLRGDKGPEDMVRFRSC